MIKVARIDTTDNAKQNKILKPIKMSFKKHTHEMQTQYAEKEKTEIEYVIQVDTDIPTLLAEATRPIAPPVYSGDIPDGSYLDTMQIQAYKLRATQEIEEINSWLEQNKPTENGETQPAGTVTTENE